MRSRLNHRWIVETVWVQGFGLLEAIVSLAIVSVVGMAAYSWINSNLVAISKVERSLEQAQLVPDILSMMQATDITQNPTGSSQLGNYEVLWGSELVEAQRDMIHGVRGIGLYRVGLYHVNVTVNTLDGVLVHQLRLEKVGYSRVREPVKPF